MAPSGRCGIVGLPWSRKDEVPEMFATPMTVIVVIAVVICFIVGLAAIRRAMRNQSRAGRNIVCPHCRTPNPGHAKFCAGCGEALR